VKKTLYEVHHYATFTMFCIPPFHVQVLTLCSKKPSAYVPPFK